MSETSSTATLLGGLPRPGFVETLASELAVTAATLARTISVSARRVGVVADTHCHSPDGSDLADTVLEALRGLDLILHCGDIDSLGVLDRLETVAPVIAVRSRIDPMADGVRLHEGPLLIRAGRTLIGMSTDLPYLMDPAVLFGTEVDLALSGTSHVPHVGRVGTTLLVNPGSPTIPLSSSGPTIATIELDGPESTVRIVHLPRSKP